MEDMKSKDLITGEVYSYATSNQLAARANCSLVKVIDPRPIHCDLLGRVISTKSNTFVGSTKTHEYNKPGKWPGWAGTPRCVAVQRVRTNGSLGDVFAAQPGHIRMTQEDHEALVVKVKAARLAEYKADSEKYDAAEKRGEVLTSLGFVQGTDFHAFSETTMTEAGVDKLIAMLTK